MGLANMSHGKPVVVVIGLVKRAERVYVYTHFSDPAQHFVRAYKNDVLKELQSMLSDYGPEHLIECDLGWSGLFLGL